MDMDMDMDMVDMVDMVDLSGHGEEGGDPESHPRRHSLRVEPEVHLQPQS